MLALNSAGRELQTVSSDGGEWQRLVLREEDAAGGEVHRDGRGAGRRDVRHSQGLGEPRLERRLLRAGANRGGEGSEGQESGEATHDGAPRIGLPVAEDSPGGPCARAA